MNDFFTKWQENGGYFHMLKLMGQLSNLFSDSEIPYIHYRVTENVFCKYFQADNLSRTDTAYDAKIGQIGIGIKTFQLSNNQSIEKIAEFNALSPVLRTLQGDDLAYKLAEYRNERMKTANDLYNIQKPVYHIVGRVKGRLEIFNVSYDFIDFNHIRCLEDTPKNIKFSDGKHDYVFNKSKSVLMKRFVVPNDKQIIPVKIIQDPYAILEKLEYDKMTTVETKLQPPHVILPLFSTNAGKNINAICNENGKFVPAKSGLNQWNAAGRRRDPNEVYIPIPHEFHKRNPDFFPPSEVPFRLKLPDGNVISAKLCQEGSKALMSNPNKALGNWILRKVLHLKERELLTINKLDEVGFDSLIVFRNGEKEYAIDVSYSESYLNNSADD